MQADTIRKVYERARLRAWDATPIGSDREDGQNFLVVNIDTKTFELVELRNTLNSYYNKPDELTRVVQVVGDSGISFSRNKIENALAVLSDHIDNATILEYGFTCVEHDANWLVSEYLAKRVRSAQSTSPNTIAETRVVANLVGQSIEALETTGWSGSEHVHHYTLLYSSGAELTRFGDDTWLSDGMMFAEHDDMMICFEGGPQAFHQCVNVLMFGVRVSAVRGLRPNGDARFSAAQMLACLNEATAAENSPVEDYLRDHAPAKKEQIEDIRADIERLARSNRNIHTLVRIIDV
ncbi:hypothetical protein LTR05_002443 [Lithohypha guttulata]|uniref:Uncharacterized protein n=1 Tax=Lithohypha guttulata TaxID=1690604 RepID=A0AAN7T2A7_9EURO|nr:hypothetical protein LTR05_002443 [Lithohypha guttulata]